MDDRNDPTMQSASDPSRARKPYEAPCIVESAQFETLALACAKFPDDLICEYSGAPTPTTNS